MICYLKIFLSRALATPFSAEQNHLCNFGRRQHEEQFCGIIFIGTSGSGVDVV